MYTYIVTDDFKVIIYDENGIEVNNPGPWDSFEDADLWASRYIQALNSGNIPTEE